MWLCCSKHYFIGQWHALLRAPGVAEGLESVTLPSPLCSRPSIDVLRGYFSRRGAVRRPTMVLCVWPVACCSGKLVLARAQRPSPLSLPRLPT